MKAVIFAGGQGTRLRPITNQRPKPMVEVGGRPIAEWQINWLKHHGVKSFLFLGGYLFDVLEDYVGDGRRWGVHVEYVREEEPLGSGGALYNARDILKGEEEFFVLNGDIITDFDITLLRKPNYVATMALFPFRSPYGIVNVEGEKVLSFEEKPVLKDYWINSGVYYATKDIFEYLPRPKGDISFDTFPKLAAAGKLGGHRYLELYFRMIDSMKDLDEANKDVASGKIGM